MQTVTNLLAGFDNTNHAKLIHVLEYEHGVRGTALKWFLSYLSRQYFQVKFGDIRSDPCPLVCDGSQSWILDPVSFNLSTRPPQATAPQMWRQVAVPALCQGSTTV